MSHRVKSHCCCDGVDPEDPDVIATNCHLGFGKPPKKAFDLSGRGGYANGANEDNCYPEANVYSNSYGQNPWDNHAYCSHDVNSELIVTIERVANGDMHWYGAYMFPDVWCPQGAESDQDCGAAIAECQKVSTTGIPRSTFYSYSNEPMYLRYRRLSGKFGDPANPFGDGSQRDWTRHPGKIVERGYCWRPHGYSWGATTPTPNDRNLPGFNSGDTRLPLTVSPFADPLKGPADQFYPHGTAAVAFNKFGNCTRTTTPYANCDDILCVKGVPNGTYLGYYNLKKCAKMKGVGPFNNNLTLAQEQLIGFPFRGSISQYEQSFPILERSKDGWDTTKHGTLPPLGQVQNCYNGDNCPDPDDPDPGPRPYFNVSRDYGGRWFWLQGILDHDYYNLYNLETGEEDTTISRRKFYRQFIHWPVGNIPGVPQVREIWSSGSCDEAPAGLWDLGRTLMGVCYRTTSWERYWDGRKRESFDNLGEDGNPWGDGTVSYFPENSSGDDLGVSNAPLPKLITFACAGVPIFSWEPYFLYKKNVYADTTLPNASEETLFELGLRSLVPDEVIKRPEYQIPDEWLRDIIASFAPQSGTAQWANELLAMIQDQNGGPGTFIDAQQRKNLHFSIIFFCFHHSFDLPAAVTDLMEKSGILPPPRNWGEDYDYKLFKKKMRFYDLQTDTVPDPSACCFNLHAKDKAVGYGNSSIPYSNDDASLSYPPGLSRELLAGVCGDGSDANNYCKWFPGFCDPAGTIHKPTEDIITRVFPFTHPATDDLGNPDPLAGQTRHYILARNLGDPPTNTNGEGIAGFYVTGSNDDPASERKVFSPFQTCLKEEDVEPEVAAMVSDDQEFIWNFQCMPQDLIIDGARIAYWPDGVDQTLENIVFVNQSDRGEAGSSEGDFNEEEYYGSNGIFNAAGDGFGYEEIPSDFDTGRLVPLRNLQKYFEESTKSRTICVNLPYSFDCRELNGGQYLEGEKCDDTRPEGFTGTDAGPPPEDWEGTEEEWWQEVWSQSQLSGLFDPNVQSFCLGPSGTSLGSCCASGRPDNSALGFAGDDLENTKYYGCAETNSTLCLNKEGSAPELFAARSPGAPEDTPRIYPAEEYESGGYAGYAGPGNFQYILGTERARQWYSENNPPLMVDPLFNEDFTFERFTNCAYGGAICLLGQGGGVIDWGNAPDLDPNGDPDEPNCPIWQEPRTRDFYFYGAQGGWEYQCKTPSVVLEDGTTVLAATCFTLHQDWKNPADGDCMNPAPFPVETRNVANSPIPQDCCAKGEPYNDGWCHPVLFVFCDNPLFPATYGGAGDIVDPDTDGDNQPPTGSDPGIIMTCTDYSATQTCRGVWWQFQSNDYWSDLGETEDGDIPGGWGGGKRRAGCDLANNCFWLVTPPYEVGTKHEFKLGVGDDGVTRADWYYIDPVTENSVSTNGQLVMQRGFRNKISFNNVRRSIYDYFLKDIGAVILSEGTESERYEFFVPFEFLSSENVTMRDPMFGQEVSGWGTEYNNVTDFFDEDYILGASGPNADDPNNPWRNQAPILGITMELEPHIAIYAQNNNGNVLTAYERWKYTGDDDNLEYEFNPFEQLDRIPETKFNGNYRVSIEIRLQQTDRLPQIQNLCGDNPGSDGICNGEIDGQLVDCPLVVNINEDAGWCHCQTRSDGDGNFIAYPGPGCYEIQVELFADKLLTNFPGVLDYVQDGENANALIEIVDDLDYQGTSRPGDPEYKEFECDLNRIRYSGIAARMSEYQWYHPPYVVHTGDPAEVYVCGPDFCNSTCAERRQKLPWGQCPNSISMIYACPWKSGRKSGPPGFQTSGSDPIYPSR